MLYLSFSSVFISNKTVNVAGEHHEVPHRQVAKPANCSSSFSFLSQATAMMAKAITMTQTRRSGNSPRVLHSHHSVLKEINLFSSDFQALQAST